uniref:T6SS Phospholipase effector Tle1-like catalytic domain-containing protein n=1 Tax=viral metagenome TaxID=1070528 RepID=A0A6C0JE28_9ZZZZ
MKRIIICADGTWDKPEEDTTKDFPTNVLKLTRMIKMSNTEIPQQIFYNSGIGTNQFFKTIKLYKGVTGSGLQDHVINYYRYLVHNYNLGDEIFLFGFSRGAYTIRSLCGLINNCGILRHEHANRIHETFLYYKNPHSLYKPDTEFIKKFQTDYCHKNNKIKFVGVWDTVAALSLKYSKKDSFYNTKMGSNIHVVRHALALDEPRKKFKPTLWQDREDENLLQMWFAGSHSDVGGGYYTPDNNNSLLSNVSLLWMIKEAKKFGLEVENYSHLDETKHIFAKIHNPRIRMFLFRKKYLRKIKGPKEAIHPSVHKRSENIKYEPKNLSNYLKTHKIPIFRL